MTSTSPVSGPTSGPVVGGYRLLTRIGEGGMGVVHLAEGPDGRRVALKVLRPHVVGDDEARQRLAREVASLRQVHSRHVAEVLDADPWGEVPYVVTRFVPGHSLHETVVRDGPLPVADLDHVGRRLLEAVRDVHAAEVLHRDLKPTNVVMEGRSPILIDFGLARLAEDPRLTVAGWLLGTPGYLAPEMLFGDPATQATDVHGWAATMVYAATGRSPYGAGHTMAILDRTRRGEADLTGVQEPLRAVLADCLALEPLERPSVHELAHTLDGLAGPAAPGPASARAAAGADPVVPTPPAPPTMPWPLVTADPPAGSDAPTVVQPAVAGTVDPPTIIQPPVQSPVQSPVQPPAQPTRHHTAVSRAVPAPPPPPPTRVQPGPAGGPPPAYIAPTPGLAGPAAPRGGPPAVPPHLGQPAPGQPYARPLPTAQRPADRPLTGWGRLVRGTSLLLLGALVTVAFVAAPYLAAFGVAGAVVLLRGAAFAHEASWRRRTARGPRWSDRPRAVVGYPWHVLRGLPGSAFLLLTAAVLAAAVLGTALVLGFADREALLAGGLAVTAAVWWGPGSQRVRLPVGRGLTAAVRHPLTAVATVALFAGLSLGGWAVAQSGPSWVPGTDAPWSSVSDLVPAELRPGP